MASSLSNLINNLAEEIHKIQCKYRQGGKKYETCRIKQKDCDCFLEYTKFKDDLMKCKCLYNTRTIKKKFEENYFLTHTYFLTMIPIVYFIVAKRCLAL